ncbi:MAG: lamin tail domain-containing protein [Candidatus Nealsonbacteria bacterium]|nr:lamin tail domain-containing protein [Candidatus Nealsonbacteria bacterium]
MKKVILPAVFVLLLFLAGVFLFIEFREEISDKIKNFVFQKNIFSPAALISSSLYFSDKFLPEEQLYFKESKINDSREKPSKVKTEINDEELKLLELQEILDDLTEKADLIAREIEEMTKKEILKDEEQEILEKEIEDEKDKDKELKEEPEKEKFEKEQNKEIVFCNKIPGIGSLRKTIIFNEIAWSGTKTSANDEWIELKNISNSPVDLKNWQILDKAGQIKIVFEENRILFPQSLYLLERTDDNSAPGAAADFIYQGILNDDEEELYLFNDNCALEDEIIAVPYWPAGDKIEKKSMERGADLNWHSYCGGLQNGISGTPKNQNSFCFSNSAGVGSNPQAPLVLEEKFPKILITEVQIEGNESFFDFIEIYNSSTYSVDISSFQLKRKSSSGTEYSIRIFPEGSVILAKDYFLWINSDYASFSQILADVSSTQTLAKNNSIALLDKEKNIIDSLAWGSSSNPFLEGMAFVENPVENQSLGRKWDKKSQNYQDTENNYQDFEIQDSSPRLINESLNQAPTSSFVFYSSSSVLEINQEIIFDALFSTDSDGEISIFYWDFGDNNSATTALATTSHSYSTFGDYLVNLMVVDDKGKISLPATLSLSIVFLEPILEIEPDFFDFQIEKGATSSEIKNLIIKNSGKGDLNWFIFIAYATDTTQVEWLSISSTSNILLASSSFSLEISIIPDSLKAGVYSAKIKIESMELVLKSVLINLVIFKNFLAQDVVINEIAWMGTEANASDEWIELFNNTEEEIDLTGWKIKSSEGSSEIELSGKILTQNYFLLERTDDQTISNIKADQVYTGALGNDGEKLELRDASNNLIDFIDCSSGWFFGQNQKIGDEWTRASMERKNPKNSGNDLLNWATNDGLNIIGEDAESNYILGTPKQQNSAYLP